VFQIAYGQVTDTLAEILLRWLAPAPPPAWRLTAKGPYCALARTLPSRFTFAQVGATVWRAEIVDPCFWSPDMPARYRLEISGADVEPADTWREFGIRHFGVAKDHFRLNRRRWVFRAASAARLLAATSLESLVPEAHAVCLGLVIEPGDQRLAEACSRAGVMLAQRLPADDWNAALIQASIWPAVAMVILPGQVAAERAELRAAAPNQVVLADLSGGLAENTPMMPDWCDGFLAGDDPQQLARLRATGDQRPMLAVTATGRPIEVSAARRACEQLQQRLAPQFDLSGYIVS
jgi:hypothetical protein